MQVEKIKHQATLCRSDGRKLDVNLFLSPYAEGHSGRELILDILHSDASFLPMEDIRTGAIILFNKDRILSLEIAQRDLLDETLLSQRKRVQVELTNGETLNMSFFLEMPEERSRVSDYLNSELRFLYLCGDDKDIILNKAFAFSVKELSSSEIQT